MNPAITVAVITACVTALGWLVTNRFSELREQQKVEYNWRSCVNWPIQFEKDVITTFEYLKDKHCELLGILHRQRRSGGQKGPRPQPQQVM